MSTTVLTIKQSHITIKAMKKAGIKFDVNAHTVALSGVAHWMDCGDNGILTDLVKAMPKSARGNALKFWISKHTANGLKWSKTAHAKAGGYTGAKPVLTEEEKANILEQADAAPFYEKEDKEASVFNDKASILSLIKKLNAHSRELSEEGVAILSYASSIMAKSA